MITKKQIVDYYNNNYCNADFEEELLEAIREWVAVVSITRSGYSQDKLPSKEVLVPGLGSTSLIPTDRMVDPRQYVIGCYTKFGGMIIDIADLIGSGNFTGEAYLRKYIKEMEEEQEKLLLQLGKYQDAIDVAKNNWKKYKEREGL